MLKVVATFHFYIYSSEMETLQKGSEDPYQRKQKFPKVIMKMGLNFCASLCYKQDYLILRNIRP